MRIANVAAGGNGGVRGRLDIVPIWTYDAREMLDLGSATAWVLSPLMRGGDRPEVLTRSVRRIQELRATPEERADLLAILRVFGERRLGPRAWSYITLEMVMASTLFEEIAEHVEATRSERWIQRGRQEGVEEARRLMLEEWRQATAELITQQFGQVPRAAILGLRSIEEPSVIRDLLVTIPQCASLDQVVARVCAAAAGEGP